MTNHDDHKDMKFWVGLFIGGMIGVIILFLLGSKEGKKTKKAIEEKGRELIDDLTDKLDQLEHQGKKLVKQGEELKAHIVEEIEDKKEYLTHEASEKIDQALARVEELQEKGREETQMLRKRLFKNLPKKK